MSALEEAEALATELASLYEAARVREQQIALARAYWAAVRIVDALRVAA